MTSNLAEMSVAKNRQSVSFGADLFFQLKLVVFVSFSALTLLFGWENLCCISPEVLFQIMWKKKD